MNRYYLNAMVVAFCVVSVSDPLIAKKGGYPYPGGGGDSSEANPEIAFQTNGRGKYAYDLVIANSDGSHPTIIRSASSPVRAAEFCPTNDKYVLFRESASGGNVLRRLYYDYSDTDIWVDGNVETIETGHNISSFDISPDGQNVVFNDGDGKLWLKSLVDPALSSQYVFGDTTLMFAFKAVWLQTENRLAIAYDDKTDTEGVMITVIDIDPSENPVRITNVRAPVTIPAETIPMTSIESARTHDGVIVSLRSEAGIVKRKGQTSILYKYVVHEWDLREPDELVPLGPVGGEVEGTQPCFSADDLFVLTTDGDDILRTSVRDGTSSVVGYGSSSDWKADPALSPLSP